MDANDPSTNPSRSSRSSSPSSQGPSTSSYSQPERTSKRGVKNFCAVESCRNDEKSVNEQGDPIQFFQIPASDGAKMRKIREKWDDAVPGIRDAALPTYRKVCEEHFVEKRPTQDHPAPELKLGEAPQFMVTSKEKREKRKQIKLEAETSKAPEKCLEEADGIRNQASQEQISLTISTSGNSEKAVSPTDSGPNSGSREKVVESDKMDQKQRPIDKDTINISSSACASCNASNKGDGEKEHAQMCVKCASTLPLMKRGLGRLESKLDSMVTMMRTIFLQQTGVTPKLKQISQQSNMGHSYTAPEPASALTVEQLVKDIVGESSGAQPSTSEQTETPPSVKIRDVTPSTIDRNEFPLSPIVPCTISSKTRSVPVPFSSDSPMAASTARNGPTYPGYWDDRYPKPKEITISRPDTGTIRYPPPATVPQASVERSDSVSPPTKITKQSLVMGSGGRKIVLPRGIRIMKQNVVQSGPSTNSNGQSVASGVSIAHASASQPGIKASFVTRRDGQPVRVLVKQGNSYTMQYAKGNDNNDSKVSCGESPLPSFPETVKTGKTTESVEITRKRKSKDILSTVPKSKIRLKVGSKTVRIIKNQDSLNETAPQQEKGSCSVTVENGRSLTKNGENRQSNLAEKLPDKVRENGEQKTHQIDKPKKEQTKFYLTNAVARSMLLHSGQGFALSHLIAFGPLWLPKVPLNQLENIAEQLVTSGLLKSLGEHHIEPSSVDPEGKGVVYRKTEPELVKSDAEMTKHLGKFGVSVQAYANSFLLQGVKQFPRVESVLSVG